MKHSNTTCIHMKYIDCRHVCMVIKRYFFLGGQLTVINLWGKKASCPMHFIFVGTGIGSGMVPLILAPFISQNLPKAGNDTIGVHCSATTLPDTEDHRPDWNTTAAAEIIGSTHSGEPKVSTILQYGFFIIAGIGVLISLVWFVYACSARKRLIRQKSVAVSNIRKSLNFNSCIPGRSSYSALLFLLMFLWIFGFTCLSRYFAKYIYLFARLQHCWSKDSATMLLTLFWISFTTGRFLGFVISKFFHMRYVVLTEGLITIISSLIMFFSSSNSYGLWIGTCLFGAIAGPLHPSIIAWGNQYMTLTPAALTALTMAVGVSEFAGLFISGYMIEVIGIQMFTPSLLIFGVEIFLIPVIMLAVTHCYHNTDSEEGERKKLIEN